MTSPQHRGSQPDGDHDAGPGPHEGKRGPLLTKHHVAALLGIDDPETIVRQHRKWGLPSLKVGRELRWREADVHDWIDRQDRHQPPGD